MTFTSTLSRFGGSICRFHSVQNVQPRHRKLQAVEAAKKRGRASDARLMERAFRQVEARRKSGRAAKARYDGRLLASVMLSEKTDELEIAVK